MDVAGRGNVEVASTSLYIKEYLVIPAKDCRYSARIFNGFGLVWFLIGRIASME